MYNMHVLIWIVIWRIGASIEVTFQIGSNQEVLIYPQETQYIRDSCECLKRIQATSQQLFIRFKGLQVNEPLYYEFSQPPIIEEYESLNVSEVSSRVNISFKGFGSQKLLYFEYQNDQVEIRFSFVNKTMMENSKYMEPFDASYIILSVSVSILVLFLSNYIRIYRFDAFSVQWWFALIYIGVFGAYILIMDLTNGNPIKYTQYVLVGGLSILASGFLVGELAYAAGLKLRVWKIQTRDIAALIVTGSLIVWRIEGGNTWYVNNIFGIAIIYSILRIFRVRSIRASLFFLAITSAVHIGLEIGYILSGSRIGLNLINQYPSPLQLQIPALIYLVGRRCVWVEATDILFPALIVGYCRRLDASFNISVYSIVATICIILSLGLQISIYVGTLYAIELPQSVFSVPLLLITLFIVSSRRGEWSILWYGGFHDKMAERVSMAKSVEWETLTKDMEKNLLVN